MKSILLTVIAGLAFSITSQNAAAQQTLTCIERNTGRQVPIVTNTSVPSPAFSTIDERTGTPYISINVPMLQNYGIVTSQATLVFIVEHECGHVNLGHLTNGPQAHKKSNQQELAADCYAAQVVRGMGFTPEVLKAVLLDVIKLPKDPDHPAGTVRAQNIVACFKR